MSKILIYSHADAQNIIDDYVLYALAALKNDDFTIYFCTRSNLPPTEKSKVEQFVEQVLVMSAEVTELDVWKKAVLAFRGKLADCEQLLFLNDTCYGPIFPLDPLFEKMRSSQADFWVLTERYSPSARPDPLASSFISFSHGAIHSELFWNFWNNLPDGSNSNQLSLPEMMSQAGFSFARAIDIQDQRQDSRFRCQEPFSHNITDFLIRHCHLPFIPIKSFCHDYTQPFAIGGLVMRAMEQSGSSYPQEYIYQHLYRLFPLSLQRTLPGNIQVFQRNKPDCRLISPLKIAVICHIFSTDGLEGFLQYLHNIPQKFDLLVTTVSEENKVVILSFLQKFDEIDNIFVRIIPNHGRDIYPWLTAFRDIHDNYDLCLKIHCKKSVHLPQSLADSWQLFLMDSLLASKDYTIQVINHFISEPTLGIMLPHIPPLIRIGFPESIYEVSDYRDKWLEILGLSNHDEKKFSVFSAGTMFWYRPQALQKLLHANISRDIFPEEPLPITHTMTHGAERVVGYVAQAAGYKCQWLITQEQLLDTFHMYEDKLSMFVEKPAGTTNQHCAYPHLNFVYRVLRKLLAKMTVH